MKTLHFSTICYDTWKICRLSCCTRRRWFGGCCIKIGVCCISLKKKKKNCKYGYFANYVIFFHSLLEVKNTAKRTYYLKFAHNVCNLDRYGESYFLYDTNDRTLPSWYTYTTCILDNLANKLRLHRRCFHK